MYCPITHFSNKKKSTIYLSNRALFRCSESCSRALHFAANRSTFVACPTRLCCCFKQENTSTPKSAFFASQASFVFLLKTRVFASAALPFPTTAQIVDRESPSSFVMSARLRFGSRLVHCREFSSFLFTTLGFTSSRSWFLAIRNGKSPRVPKIKQHDANVAVTQVLLADRAHAGAVVANCFCNCRHS